LATFKRQSHLYIIPFGDIQNAIAKSCHEEYRTILFRKYMILTANLLCDRIGANAIITGDSLGQVSSQTLTNLSLMDKASDKIILRPLVGFNKLEVIRLAEKIGTHDISVIPHDDACALFAPENPVTNANITYWKEHESENDLTDLLNKAIDTAGVYSVNAIGELFKKEYFSFDS
jgi:thiamine biosynthesis protein ThiI